VKKNCEKLEYLDKNLYLQRGPAQYISHGHYQLRELAEFAENQLLNQQRVE